MDKSIALLPRVSEKSYQLSESQNVYVFVVPKSANKITVKSAVKAQFNVEVTNVRIANLPSKPKRSTRAGGRKVSKGIQPGVKKAYVTLKKGDSIPVFATEDEKPKKEKDKK
jgi:large subunit ribosomal protein L23